MLSQRNQLRQRSVLVSRSFKAVFTPDQARPRWHRWLAWILWPTSWRARFWQATFSADAHGLGREANHVLADLRDFCFAEKTSFDPDPHIAARREGRRDVWLRIQRYLNLDEAMVQKLMEIDDE